MSSELLDPRWIQARLRAHVASLRDVRGAADYALLTKGIQDFAPDEAFVISLGEEPLSNDPQMRGRQVALSFFGVVIATRHYSDAQGEEAINAAKPIIGAVRDALIGWTPTDATGTALSGARPCTWQGGKVLDYSAETLLWSEVFMTQHNIGSHL